MNTYTNTIEHLGYIKSTDSKSIRVSLVGQGCSSCHNSLCMLGESKSKEIELKSFGQHFAIGDEVLVRINPSSGYAAVLLLYLIPFLLMMCTLWMVLRSGLDEGLAGISSLLILIPYYGVLYLFRKQLGSQCKIDITKR